MEGSIEFMIKKAEASKRKQTHANMSANRTSLHASRVLFRGNSVLFLSDGLRTWLALYWFLIQDTYPGSFKAKDLKRSIRGGHMHYDEIDWVGDITALTM